MRPSRYLLLRAGFSLGLLLLSLTAAAHTVTVTVPGPLDPRGGVGCGLFAGERGFPMDNGVARMQWQPARADGVTCVFSDVADGSYAVSVLVDMNGNRRVDTSFVGLPTEAWGVSNNSRPTLRAPRFDEAAFRVVDGRPVELTIRVAR